MVEMTKKETSHWWWFDSHQSSPRSPWLQATLGELDKKTKAILKLIEEDADSFAQRVEMYYKKRPELISMVEDYYRTHRSLAESYDQLRSDSVNRLLTTVGSPFLTKYKLQKLMGGGMDKAYDRSETYDLEDSAESEVDDPEQEDETQPDEHMGEIDDPEEEDETQPDEEMGEIDDTEKEDETQPHEEIGEVEEPEHKVEARQVQVEVLASVYNDEVMKLREEIKRLEEENRIQKDQLLQKDEEKREVIRQLSLAVEIVKLENMKLRKRVAIEYPKKRSLFEFEKLKEVFSGKLFNGSSNSRRSVVAL